MKQQKVALLPHTVIRPVFQSFVHLMNRWMISPQILILSCLLIFALTLGMIGLDHGLPYFNDVDEYGKAKIASRMAALNKPSPGWFGHPGSTFLYPLAFLYKMWGSVAYGVPLWQENPALYELLRENPETSEHPEPGWAVYYLIGRGLNVLYFVAGIFITYLVGVRVWDKRVALLAAWFMAITPLLLSYAQIMRTDHAGLLFYILALLTCLRLLSTRRWYDYAIAGIAIGVAGSSRYFNLSLGATLILAHFLVGAHRESGHWKRLFLGLVAIAGGFLLTTPAFVFSLDTVYKNLIHESRSSINAGKVPLPYVGRFWWYLSVAIPDALTWPVWLLSIGGIVLTWWRGRTNHKAILLAFSFVIFLLTISVPSLYWQRWMIPVIPIALLSAGRMLWIGIDAWTNYKPNLARWGNVAAILFILALSIIPLKATIQQAYVMTQPDTRTLAMQWIEQNVPAGSRIVRERYTAFIPDDNVSVEFSYYLHKLSDNETLADQYDYFVASSWAYERFYKTANFHPEEVAFYEKIFENDDLIAEFKPDPWQATGPTIRIYHIPN